jgi:hypothetical protein
MTTIRQSYGRIVVICRVTTIYLLAVNPGMEKVKAAASAYNSWEEE